MPATKIVLFSLALLSVVQFAPIYAAGLAEVALSDAGQQ
jgi:hypothetical protein